MLITQKDTLLKDTLRHLIIADPPNDLRCGLQSVGDGNNIGGASGWHLIFSQLFNLGDDGWQLLGAELLTGAYCDLRQGSARQKRSLGL